LNKHYNRKDINERKMEEEVHGFAADNVPANPLDRKETKYG